MLKVTGDDHRGRRFALIIDEAHSSQSGRTAGAMNATQGDTAYADDEEPDAEDVVNAAIEKRMAARKMMTNASYFAFTATPKNKTLEMFGEALPPDAQGKVRHKPFHSYTMKHGYRRAFHSGCAQELHPGAELLWTGQEGGRRPAV
jgi:type I restriction enzyme R subunit